MKMWRAKEFLNILYRASSSSQSNELCPICMNETDIRDWNCKNGCKYKFCRECKNKIKNCPLCKEPYGISKNLNMIPDDIDIIIYSSYSLKETLENKNRIEYGNGFYMSTKKHFPESIPQHHKKGLGPIWTKIVLDEEDLPTAFDSMIEIGSGKGLKMEITEKWNNDSESGLFKIRLTTLRQEGLNNVERTHTFQGGDETKHSVYYAYQKEGRLSPSSSRRRNLETPPEIPRKKPRTFHTNTNKGPFSLNFGGDE